MSTTRTRNVNASEPQGLSEAPVDTDASGHLHALPPLAQFATLFRVELTNWRWSWTTMLLRGTVTPLLSLLALGVFARDAGQEALIYVMTGNVVVGLLFGAMDAVHSHITFLRFDGAMDYFATLPIHKSLWVLAMTASFLLLSLPSLLLTLVLGPLLLDVQVHPTLWLVVTVPLCAAALAGVGAVLGLIGRTRSESLNIGFLLTLTMGALGPIIIPPDRLPGIMRVVGVLVPSTYAASAFRQTLVGPVTPRLALDLAVLGAIAVATLGLVSRKMSWRQA